MNARALASAPAGWWRAEGDPARPAPVTTSRLAFGGLLAFTVVLVVSPQSFIPALAPLRLAFVAAVTALAAHILHQSGHGRPLSTATREVRIAAALGTWAVLSVPFSLWPSGSVSFLFDLYIKTLLAFALVANLVDGARRLRAIVWTLSLSVVPVALVGIKSYLAGDFVEGRRIVGYGGALASNPNDLALMLNLMLPLCFALLLAQRRFVPRLLLGSTIGLSVVAVVCTFSRAGFLCLAVVVAGCLLRLARGRHRAWRWVVPALALAALPALPASYVDRLATIGDVDSDPTGSAQERWRDTVAAARYVAAHPLIGAGVGANALALNEERGAHWRLVHNAYLEHAVELGLPGLALFLALFVSCALTARRAARSLRTDVRNVARGLEVSLATFAVAAFFHPVAYQFYFYYLGGLSVAVGRLAGPEVETCHS